MVLPDRLRYINKVFTNRIMRLIAGRWYSPVVLIRHYGRKTGKIYETPLLLAKSVDGFVFALTYGAGVDWYRNILAAGKAELLWKGNIYFLCDPVTLPADIGRMAFRGMARLMLGWLGITGFFMMRVENRINSD